MCLATEERKCNFSYPNFHPFKSLEKAIMKEIKYKWHLMNCFVCFWNNRFFCKTGTGKQKSVKYNKEQGVSEHIVLYVL